MPLLADPRKSKGDAIGAPWRLVVSLSAGGGRAAQRRAMGTLRFAAESAATASQSPASLLRAVQTGRYRQYQCVCRTFNASVPERRHPHRHTIVAEVQCRAVWPTTGPDATHSRRFHRPLSEFSDASVDVGFGGGTLRREVPQPLAPTVVPGPSPGDDATQSAHDQPVATVTVHGLDEASLVRAAEVVHVSRVPARGQADDDDAARPAFATTERKQVAVEPRPVPQGVATSVDAFVNVTLTRATAYVRLQLFAESR